jgi:hypothetical protein
MPGEYELGDLGGVLGSNLYDSLFSSQGFSGYNDGTRGGGPIWATAFGDYRGEETAWNPTPNEDALAAFDNYTFNWQPQGGQAGLLTAFDPQGNTYGTYRQKGEDNFTKLIGMVAPMIATGAFGGALSGMFGGGFLGGAAGHGLASGSMTAAQGGDFGKGFLGGAVSGGIQGLNATGSSPASMAGINSPTLAKMYNRAVGGTLGSLASGNSGSDALKSGLTGAALSGINSVGKSVMNPYIESFKSWLGTDTSGGDAEFDALQGSGGDMSMQTDVSPNRYDEFLMGPDGMETYNPDYRFGGDQMMDSFSSPDQSVQSSTGQPNFSLQSVLGDVGSRVGNFALNNAGDLASMLYGFYNNRRQQRQLQQPMNNMSNQVNQATTQLQNMFTQNSPYAQQLRAKLNAQAAQSGRRSNVAGRETQFQAMLAEKAASTLPQIANMQNSLMQNQLQMQQRRGQLQSSLGSNTISLLGKMGAFNGLANMFGPSTSTIPYNNGNVSGSDMFGWKGSGGM